MFLTGIEKGEIKKLKNCEIRQKSGIGKPSYIYKTTKAKMIYISTANKNSYFDKKNK